MNAVTICAGLGLLLQLSSFSVEAAPASGSISSTVGALGSVTDKVRLPYVGVLSNVSLASLEKVPILSNVQLPILQTGFSGVPVIGMITIHEGIQVIQAVKPLQQPLPGLGALDVVIEKLEHKKK